MMRDWDVVRRILLALEPKGLGSKGLHSLTDCEHDTFVYHIQILSESGLIHGVVRRNLTDGSFAASGARLTWSGHELLDKIRDDSTWGEVKATARKSGLTLTFDLVRDIATDIAAKTLAAMTSP